MELFLLMSMGMSIVAFISIALNQAPPIQSVADFKQPENEKYSFFHSVSDSPIKDEDITLTSNTFAVSEPVDKSLAIELLSIENEMKSNNLADAVSFEEKNY